MDAAPASNGARHGAPSIDAAPVQQEDPKPAEEKDVVMGEETSTQAPTDNGASSSASTPEEEEAMMLISMIPENERAKLDIKATVKAIVERGGAKVVRQGGLYCRKQMGYDPIGLLWKTEVTEAWPMVKCHQCDKGMKWKQGLPYRVCRGSHEQHKLWDRVYVCMDCHCTLQNVDMAEAKEHRKRLDGQKAAWRAQGFKQYMDKGEVEVNLTHRAARAECVKQAKVSIRQLKDAWQPLWKHAEKVAQRETQDYIQLAKYDSLLRELRETNDRNNPKFHQANKLEKQDRILKALEEMDKVLQLNEQTLAFRGPNVTDCPDMMWRIAQYCDKWIDVEGGALYSWYYCNKPVANEGGQLCGTLTPSKGWGRKNEDVYAAGQWWYCPRCGCRYSANYGMIIQIVIKTPQGPISGFMKSDVPTKRQEDIRALYLEELWNPTTARQLWDMIGNFQPIKPEDMFHQLRREDCVRGENLTFDCMSWRLNRREDHAALPRWDWSTLFRLASEATSRAQCEAVQKIEHLDVLCEFPYSDELTA